MTGAGLPDQAWSYSDAFGHTDTAQDVAIDSEGNVIAVGIVEKASSSQRDRDMLVRKFTPDGGLQWSRTLFLGQDDRLEGVALDGSDNIYLAGTVNPATGDDAFVRKLDPDGNTLWSKRIDKGTQEVTHGIALDEEGNVYIAGSSTSINGLDGFLIKVSPEGKEVWARAINLHFVDEAFDVAVAADGSVLVVGRTIRGSNVDILARNYLPNGTVAWTKDFGQGAREEARGVAVHPDGGYVLSGTANEPEDNRSNFNHFVMRIDENGDENWWKTFDDSSVDEGRGVAVDAWGNIVTVGITSGFSGTRDGVIRKLDAGGNLLWQRVFDGGQVDGFGAVAADAQGAVAASGASQTPNGTFEFLVVKYQQTLPAVQFMVAADAAEAGTSVRFLANGTPGTGDVTTWNWDFGDGMGARDAGAELHHTYKYGGEYDVTVTLVDGAGIPATATHRIHIDGPPAPDHDNPGGDGTTLGAVDDGNEGSGDPEEATGEGAGVPGAGVLAAVGAAVLTAVGRRRRS